ncbi:hypothetical protein L209DRAFT_748375 [Thermothelomyces heterothallicus CBS 203.75]
MWRSGPHWLRCGVLRVQIEPCLASVWSLSLGGMRNATGGFDFGAFVLPGKELPGRMMSSELRGDARYGVRNGLAPWPTLFTIRSGYCVLRTVPAFAHTRHAMRSD